MGCILIIAVVTTTVSTRFSDDFSLVKRTNVIPNRYGLQGFVSKPRRSWFPRDRLRMQGWQKWSHVPADCTRCFLGLGTSEVYHWGGNDYILKLFRFLWCNPLHCVTSSKYNPNLLMQWIASIWAPCNSYSWVAQTEQDISDPCVMNVRQAQRNRYNSEAAKPDKSLHKIKYWQFKWSNVLHRVTSSKFPPKCLMYVMFSAPMVCKTWCTLKWELCTKTRIRFWPSPPTPEFLGP